MQLRQIKKNQTELINGNKVIFFSYNTPVAACIENEYFITEKRWSGTTTRHINKWLDGVTARIRPQNFFDGLID